MISTMASWGGLWTSYTEPDPREYSCRLAPMLMEYSGRFWHNDTSTMNLQGEYRHEEGDLDAAPIEITYGFSNDHRPDLKQFVVSLVMSDDLPVFIQALNGNTSDKDHFREIVKEYGTSLQDKWGEDKIWVWDSAFYSEKNLKAISKDYIWITRVPETPTEAKDALESAEGCTGDGEGFEYEVDTSKNPFFARS